MLSKAIHFGQRRANYVIDDASERANFINVIQLSHGHYVAAVFKTARHATRLHDKTGRIGHNGLFEIDLRTIGEAGDHGWILAPFLGKPLLSSGVTIGIL